jgi:hypothetical protein
LTNEYFRAARDYALGYRELKAIARNALRYSFLDAEQKRDQLERFEQRSAEFERSVASRQSPLRSAVADQSRRRSPLLTAYPEQSACRSSGGAFGWRGGMVMRR